ncbi:hypothetical protein V5738_10815 [Salinisphaera sp. SPP-AMP-43]|uniref:hypothetical protein n=1 Tax=Salinisphaera sp. SPP-AMP-43 TaxID=3121288 RepID=UPI003C6E94B3
MSGEDPEYQATGSGLYEPNNQPEYTPDMLEANWGDESAAENQADLARAQYDDYKSRFVPVENEVIDSVGNRQTYADNVNRAAGAVSQGYETSAGEYQRGLSRYGVTPTDDQVANQKRQMGLSAAAATAEAANRARTSTKNRNMQILGGGLAPQKPTMDQ